MPRPARCLLPLLGLLLALAAGWPARAANLQISPVSLALHAGQNATAITLQNLGDQPTYGQVRVYEWDQRDGEDVLAAARDVVASPPIVQIAPHASQVIRLVRTGPAPAGERSYRVLIDEVQPPEAAASGGVDIRLRYSVPLFVAPPATGAEQLDWQLVSRAGGWWLRVHNGGSGHAQIGALSFASPGGAEAVVSQGLFGYVLPGRTRMWKLPPQAAAIGLAGGTQVKAWINGRQQSAAAAVAAP